MAPSLPMPMNDARQLLLLRLSSRTVKARQVLDLSATVTPELLGDLNDRDDRAEERSRVGDIAGEVYGPIGDLVASVARSVAQWAT